MSIDCNVYAHLLTEVLFHTPAHIGSSSDHQTLQSMLSGALLHAGAPGAGCRTRRVT